MIKLLLRLIARFLTFKVGGVYYINSTNILPAPLSEKEELALLLRVKEGDIEARNTLIIHNLRLVVFIAKKFEGTKINLEDLISIGSMGLIWASRLSNSKKTSNWPPTLPVVSKTKS